MARSYASAGGEHCVSRLSCQAMCTSIHNIAYSVLRSDPLIGLASTCIWFGVRKDDWPMDAGAETLKRLELVFFMHEEENCLGKSF